MLLTINFFLLLLFLMWLIFKMYLPRWQLVQLVHFQKAYEGGGHGRFDTTERGHVLEKFGNNY